MVHFENPRGVVTTKSVSLRRGLTTWLVIQNSCPVPSQIVPAEYSVSYPRKRHLLQTPLIASGTGKSNNAPKTRFAVWNARSMKRRGKSVSICDLIIVHKLDILAITESWLTGDSRDHLSRADIGNTLPNYQVYHDPRKDRTGGGICVILLKGFEVSVNQTPTFSSFELMDLTISSKMQQSFRLLVFYRPLKYNHVLRELLNKHAPEKKNLLCDFWQSF